MGTIKDRNGMDLREVEDIKGKNIQKNYTKKDLHDPDNHDGVWLPEAGAGSGSG